MGRAHCVRRERPSRLNLRPRRPVGPASSPSFSGFLSRVPRAAARLALAALPFANPAGVAATPRKSPCTAALAISSLVLLLAFTLGAEHARAQTAVCSSTPGSGERIECVEDAMSTADIDIQAEGIDIDTTDMMGIDARHDGTGKINITVDPSGSGAAQVRSTIDVTGTGSLDVHGVRVRHTGTGRVDVLTRSTDITAAHELSDGINVRHWGEGDVLITVDEGSEIDAQLRGVYGEHTDKGELEIRILGSSTIVTRADGAWGGVYARHEGDAETNDSVVVVKNSAVTTMGDQANAVWSERNGAGTAV